MEQRIRIPIDLSSFQALTKELERMEKVYKDLQDGNKKLTESVEGGNKKQAGALAESNKRLEEAKTKLDELRKGAKGLNNEQPVEKMAQSFVPLNRQLKEARNEMQLMVEQGKQNTVEFEALAKKSAHLTDQINDTKDIMRNFATQSESSLNGMNNAFSLFSTGLSQMDFGAMEIGLQGMNNSMKSINVKETAENFISLSKTLGGTLVTGLKTLGNVFISVGKIILANPLFLIATVITGIIVAVVSLKDKFKVLGVVFDAIMMPINALIDGLKALGDWLGLTNFAEQELADKRAERAKAEADRITNDTQRKQNAVNREIKLIQAKGELTETEKKQVFSLEHSVLTSEFRKQQAIQKSLLKQIEAMRVRGELDEEEKKQLDELKQKYSEVSETVKDAQTNITEHTIKRNAELKKANNEARQKEQDAQEKENEKARALAEKRRSEEKARLEKVAQERLEAEKQMNALLEKVTLDAIADENEKALAVQINAIDKERKETLKNKQLTEDERTKVNDYYNALAIKATEDNANKLAEAEKAILEKFDADKLAFHLSQLEKNATSSTEASLMYQKEKHEAELNQLTQEFEAVKIEYEKQGISTLELTDFYLDKRNQLTSEYNEKLDEIRELDKKKAFEQEQAKYDQLNKTITQVFALSKDSLSQAFASLASEITTTLQGLNALLSDETVKIGDKVAGVVSGVSSMITSILSTAQNLNKEKLDSDVEAIQNASSEQQAILDEQVKNGLITQEQAEAKKYSLQLDSFNKEEAVKKKAFEDNKKLQIAQASIAMLQGIVSAFTGAMQLGPIAGPIMGAILAGAVGVMGGINIAKIKATQYKGGTPPSGGGSIGIPTPNVENVKKDVTLPTHDTDFDGNYSQGKTQELQPQPMEVKVSVTEFNDVNKRVDNYAKVGEL